MTQQRTITLLGIWVISSVASILSIIVLYTLFFGRYEVELNETIYQGYYYTCKPGSFRIQSTEGYGITHCGQNGLVVDKELNPVALKILFLGDSYVEAQQISDAFKFTELVEEKWNLIHPNIPVQTLNMGRSGQDIEAYVSFSQNIDDFFQPNLIFLMLAPHDFRNLLNSPMNSEKILSGLTEPLITANRSLSNAGMIINTLNIQAFVSRTIFQTYSFFGCSQDPKPSCIKTSLMPIKVSAQSKFGFIAQEESNSQNFQQNQRQIEAQVSNSRIDDMATPLQLLQLIWGKRLVIIYHSETKQLDQGGFTVYQEKQRILSEIEALDIVYIDLDPLLWSAYFNHRPPTGFNNSILGKGHYNRYGHQLISEAILAYLEKITDES